MPTANAESIVISNIWFLFFICLSIVTGHWLLSYSVLSAVMGLILVARRAGSHVAINAAVIKTTGAIVKAKGSVELTWKRMALRILPVARAKRKPRTVPAA